MARKSITDSTLKKLFSLSGNTCAFPKCNHKIVDRDYNLIAEICHIEAAEAGGQRYNSSQSDEERRGFDNLMILCPNHHKVTDDVKTYTVEKLKLMKISHENKYINQEYKIEQKVLDQFKNEVKKVQKNYDFYKGQQIIAKKGNIIINFNDNNKNNLFGSLKNVGQYFEQELFVFFKNIAEKLKPLASFNKNQSNSLKIKNVIPEGLNKINIANLITIEKVSNEAIRILKKLSKKNSNDLDKSTTEILKSKVKTTLNPQSKQIVQSLITNLEKSNKTDFVQIEKVAEQNSKEFSDVLHNLNKAKSNLELGELKKIKDYGLNLVEKQKAEVCYIAGKAYLDLLMFNQAKQNFLQAYELDPDNFKIVNQLFSLAIHLEDHVMASRFIDQIIEEKNKINDIHILSELYNNLALYYHFLGDYNRSIELYNELSRYLQFSSTVNNDDIHSVTVSIVLILLIQGKASEACEYTFNALKKTIQNFSPDNPIEINNLNIARLYNCISISYAMRNQLEKALKYAKLFRKILQNLVENEYINPYVLTLSYLNYSTLQFYKGNLKEATKLTYFAKDYIQDNIGNDFSLLANTYSSFGGIDLLNGDEKKAMKNFSKALEILNSQNSRGSLLKAASILCHQGNIYNMKGEKDRSNQLYESVISIISNFFNDSNPNLIRLNFNLQNPTNAHNIILAF